MEKKKQVKTLKALLIFLGIFVFLFISVHFIVILVPSVITKIKFSRKVELSNWYNVSEPVVLYDYQYGSSSLINYVGKFDHPYGNGTLEDYDCRLYSLDGFDADDILIAKYRKRNDIFSTDIIIINSDGNFNYESLEVKKVIMPTLNNEIEERSNDSLKYINEALKKGPIGQYNIINDCLANLSLTIKFENCDDIEIYAYIPVADQAYEGASGRVYYQPSERTKKGQFMVFEKWYEAGPEFGSILESFLVEKDSIQEEVTLIYPKK